MAKTATVLAPITGAGLLLTGAVAGVGTALGAKASLDNSRRPQAGIASGTAPAQNSSAPTPNLGAQGQNFTTSTINVMKARLGE